MGDVHKGGCSCKLEKIIWQSLSRSSMKDGPHMLTMMYLKRDKLSEFHVMNSFLIGKQDFVDH